MSHNNGDDNNSRKRKMKAIAVEPSSPNENNDSRKRKMEIDVGPSRRNANNDDNNVQPLQNLPSPSAAQVQRILNSAAPRRDFSLAEVHGLLNSAAPNRGISFTSLLTAPYHPIDDLGSDVRNQTELINQIITQHSENMRNALSGVVENYNYERNLAVEGRVASRIREKELAINAINTRNAELRGMLEFYQGESERLYDRVRSLEQTAASLRRAVRDTRVGQRLARREHDDAESSFVDQDRVEPVRLDCKVCETAIATVMMMPCRHVCVCPRCDVMSRVCPVCYTRKSSSIGVRLPS